MDIRGVEITNQLRSAIRAKLLELGVRYDEELPDYILVMVVNKKSREQMNEDLNLFLEDSTEPFVNWLHDQVLKKLQKVTVAKKKNNKEIVPTAIVKKEEDRKKPKVEDESHLISDSHSQVVSKIERDREFEELVGDLALLNEEDSKISLNESQGNEDKLQKKKNEIPSFEEHTDNLEKKDSLESIITFKQSNFEKKLSPFKSPQSEISMEKITNLSQSLKRISNVMDDNLNEKSFQSTKRSKISIDSDNEDNNRIRSSINKPKITSVVSVKSRLGVISPSKKNESQTKSNNDARSRLDVRRNELTNQRSSQNHSKNIEKRKPRNDDLRSEQSRDEKSHSSSSSKNSKSSRIRDSRDKERLSNKSGTIKSRLGISTIHKQDKISIKSSNTTKVSKPRMSNVKSRLGVKPKQPNTGVLSIASRLSQIAQSSTNFEEDDDAESIINTSLRSQIIAVNKSKLKKPKSSSNTLKKQSDISEDKIKNIETKEEESDLKNPEDEDQCKVPSKIIVTPRPLKPLQPSQKRATQSLLLRAVAEANQSVVMQKKIDPCLKEQKKPANKIKITRDPWKGKIVSVNLNSKKRLVKNLEKIQIELNNPDANPAKAHSSQGVTDEHLDVVKSLFKRSDDKQKFLVTLNGYNNNILKERNSDDEERLEMEVNEDDEFVFDNNQYESYVDDDNMYDQDNDPNMEYPDHENDHENDHDLNEDIESNNYMEMKIRHKDNGNSENVRHEESFSKKRSKLSPIVYTRSRSNSPENKPSLASTISSVLRDKRPVISSVITTVADKSSEKCRYWPNCTLGIKCAYYHPEVLCSSFPACKFGDKCAYKHPKCKFGSACTKLGCIFSHPPVQCKYHPYCMKPGCQFSHPKTSASVLAPLPPDPATVRAKFTWKKKE